IDAAVLDRFGASRSDPTAKVQRRLSPRPADLRWTERQCAGMEFLIGRSLGNNITNLLLDPFVRLAAQQRDLDWLGLFGEEPDAGLGNGGLGRLAACFLDSMATMQLPAMGYGLRYEYGMFKQSIEDGWQHEQPDNWLRRQDPWEVPRPNETVEIKLSCSFEM